MAAIFTVNLHNWSHIATVEAEPSDRASIEDALTYRLRSRLGVELLDSAQEVKVECRKVGGAFTKPTPGFTGAWKMEALIQRLDAIIDTFSIASRVQRDQWGRVVVEAFVERIDEHRELLCEYPEGSGIRVFLSAEDRTRIIREGNSSPDYWIIPEGMGGQERVTRRVLLDTALLWKKGGERLPSPVRIQIDWDDEDIIF